MNEPRSTHAPIARAGQPARAIVSAGGVDTTYLRAGHGEAMVVVVDDVDSADVRSTIAALANHFLVIAAAPTLGRGTLASWLTDFLEGLGIRDAHVLLHASLPDMRAGGIELRNGTVEARTAMDDRALESALEKEPLA